MAGGQAGEVHGIFQNGEVVQEELKVSGVGGPGEKRSLTNGEGESGWSLNPQPEHPESAPGVRDCRSTDGSAQWWRPRELRCLVEFSSHTSGS